MQTIQINNSEVEQYINLVYGDNQESLMNDFIAFIKSRLIINDLKSGFDEVEAYKNNQIQLSNATDFLGELKSEY